METYYTVVTLILAVLYGLCIGSFLNVVIYRLPNNIKMIDKSGKDSLNGSFCPKCKNKIKWYDNIPLISYLILGGKCRHCKEKISPQYPIVEAANMILWALCFIIFKDNIIYACISAIAVSVGICVFAIDLKHKIIFDRFHIILGVLGIGVVLTDTSVVWYSHLIGMAVGGISFLLIGLAVSKMVGQEALGMGDVKFAFVTGLFLGWQKFLLMMLVASFSALPVMEIQRRKKDLDKYHEYPFGPFLVIGFFVALLFGSYIIDGYLSLLNF